MSTPTVEAWHGTLNGYNYRKCRCDDCRAAKAEYRAADYAANRERQIAAATAWRAANRDKLRVSQAAWRAANREKLAARERAYHAANRDRLNARSLEWYAANRDQVRERQYGLTPGQYALMLAEQENRCAICGDPFGDNIPHVDHDHACCAGAKSCGECVRGLLCNFCNQGLGRFKDEAARLGAALEYLNR